MKKQITLVIISVAIFTSLFAQKKNITLDEIWKEYKFMPKSIDELRSTTDGKHYTTLVRGEGKQAIVAYDYKTGKAADTLFTSNNIVKAGKSFMIESYAMSPGEKKILVSTGSERIFRHSTVARYFVWDREKKTLTQLRDGDEKVMYATLSPDGNRAGYVYKGDLYTKNLLDG